MMYNKNYYAAKYFCEFCGKEAKWPNKHTITVSDGRNQFEFVARHISCKDCYKKLFPVKYNAETGELLKV